MIPEPRARNFDVMARPELRLVTSPALHELPDVLTVEEAAAVLRISRGAAYELARRFRETNGAAGLPVVVLGRSLRVPRSALCRLLAGEDRAAGA